MGEFYISYVAYSQLKGGGGRGRSRVCELLWWLFRLLYDSPKKSLTGTVD